jgi:hypothetical protein
MDFVEGLPPTAQANCILVVVDKFTKYSYFIPLKHPFTAAMVAKDFLENVYKLHGMPAVIISDRDKFFTSNLWKELFALVKVDLSMSIAYHPQSDDQFERVNQCVETYLRRFVSSCPRQWISWLHLAEFWYNTSLHSSIGMSPFEALYGYQPKHFGLDEKSTASRGISQWLLDRKVVTDLVQQHLNHATITMKNQADKGRSERSFTVGEWVFFKLQPYIQSSLAPRANQKLAFKFFEHFKIVHKVGHVAYRLELPSSSIHHVFHVSFAKENCGQVSGSVVSFAF